MLFSFSDGRLLQCPLDQRVLLSRLSRASREFPVGVIVPFLPFLHFRKNHIGPIPFIVISPASPKISVSGVSAGLDVVGRNPAMNLDSGRFPANTQDLWFPNAKALDIEQPFKENSQ